MAEASTNRRLPFDRLASEENALISYCVTLPFDHDYKDMFNPEYWAHHAAKFRRQKTKITVVNDDCTLYAELFVIDCDRTWAKVREILKAKLGADTVADNPGKHAVEWKGPKLMFSIIRKDDNINVKSGFADKIAAQKWMLDFERSQAA